MRPGRLSLQVALALACASLACRSSAPAAPEAESGLIVDSLGAGGVAQLAGVQEGDALVSWDASACPAVPPRAARGALASPFEAWELEREEAPRCPVKLEGLRSAAPVAFTLVEGNWDLGLRPALARELRATYVSARKATKDGQIDTALRDWKQLAASLQGTGRPRDAAWAWTRLGDAAAKARRWPEAEAAYASARSLALAAGKPSDEAQVWLLEGAAHHKNDAIGKAVGDFASAVAVWEKSAPESLSLAQALQSAGHLALFAGDPEGSEPLLQRSLQIRERLAPQSLATARSLQLLGPVLANRGDLDGAERLLTRGRELCERHADAGLGELATILGYLSHVARRRGDLAGAQALTERGRDLHQLWRPNSIYVATDLIALADIEQARGDLEAAEQHVREGLALADQMPFAGMTAAGGHESLGEIASARGDLDAAEDAYKRSVAAYEKLVPESLHLARGLKGLAEVERQKGDAVASERLLRRALAMHRKTEPRSTDTADCLRGLALLARDRDDLESARRLFQEALDISRSAYLVDAAEDLTELGDLALAAGDLAGAERRHREALRIRQRMMPGSGPLARSWHALGLVLWKAARRAEAAPALEHALATLEAQQGRLGGADDVRSGFAAAHVDYYRDAVALLLEQKKPAEAFRVVERSRARTLLALLQERDLVFKDVPVELGRALRQLGADYDGTQEELSELNPQKQAAAVEARVARLRELRDQRAQLEARLRTASPRLASLQHPESLDLLAVRAVLDPGSVLLSYCVGREQTFLFVVQPEGEGARSGLTVLTLPVGERVLRERTLALRGMLERGRSTAGLEPDLLAQAASLYDLLVRPAQAFLDPARRVLVSADGPLHLLPFAALLSSREPARFLVEDKPVHGVLSATLYAELRKARRPVGRSAQVLAAFGDPLAARGALPAARGSEGLRLRAGRLGPLPFSRDEVAQIAALFAPQARQYLGVEATEERAHSLGSEPRYVHFATHGLLDRRFPLNSALVLSAPQPGSPGRENGLLQAWEIFESVRLDADLVTLSACESGVGKDAGGEGLISLSRAFHYAGARSVLASLWPVSDRSTATLMIRLYAGLRTGRSKDEALRTAQLELIKSGATRHPFHWAAFQLSGDWR